MIFSEAVIFGKVSFGSDPYDDCLKMCEDKCGLNMTCYDQCIIDCAVKSQKTVIKQDPYDDSIKQDPYDDCLKMCEDKCGLNMTCYDQCIIDCAVKPQKPMIQQNVDFFSGVPQFQHQQCSKSTKIKQDPYDDCLKMCEDKCGLNMTCYDQCIIDCAVKLQKPMIQQNVDLFSDVPQFQHQQCSKICLKTCMMDCSSIDSFKCKKYCKSNCCPDLSKSDFEELYSRF
uniref:Uncharacterized protein n=1 Tax=Panagrolaimus sp. PS1159 TaxID=55785 RepID=A0AC35F694_9BILA